MKYNLQVNYIDLETGEIHELGNLSFKTKEDVLDYILKSQIDLFSKHFNTRYVLTEEDE